MKFTLRCFDPLSVLVLLQNDIIIHLEVNIAKIRYYANNAKCENSKNSCENILFLNHKHSYA